jgi:hypothetical protein
VKLAPAQQVTRPGIVWRGGQSEVAILHHLRANRSADRKHLDWLVFVSEGDAKTWFFLDNLELTNQSHWLQPPACGWQEVRSY